MSDRRRHEVRENGGRLVAVIEIVDHLSAGPGATSMVELAADIGDASYRVRLFPPSLDDEPAPMHNSPAAA